VSRMIESICNLVSGDGHSMNVVVVACHPDDESIGMGGTIKILGRVANVHVVVLSNGASNKKGKEREDLISEREQELRKAGQVLSISEFHFLDQDDGYLEHQKEDAISKLARVLESVHPCVVFTHYRYDTHPDHAVAFDIVERACWWANRGNLMTRNLVSSIFEFEVYTPLLRYTELVDISAVVEDKRSAIKSYQSQDIDVDSVLGLNRFRAAHNTKPPFQGTHFEAFLETRVTLL